jgi:PAS domain S-box-containing protein
VLSEEQQHLCNTAKSKQISQLPVESREICRGEDSSALELTRQLRLSEALLEAIPSPVFYKNREGRYIGCNDAFARFIGYSRDMIMGKTVYEVAPSELARTYHERDLLLMEKGGTQRYEFKVRTMEEGTDRDVIFTKAVFLDETGNVAGIVGIMTDISERKKAEEMVRENEEKFRIITSAARDAVIMMDNEGIITFWNLSAEEIFGYSREDVLGKNLHVLLAPRIHLEGFFRAFPHWASTGEGVAVGKTVELPAHRKDGTEIPIELSLSSVNIKGKWHAIGLVRDISKRRRQQELLLKARDEAESARRELETTNRELEVALERARLLAREAARADEAKTQFLANMSHELRTPMNAILGMTELLFSSPLSREQHEELTMVGEAADRLLHLLNDLLDFSKIESGRIELEHVTFGFRDYVEQAVKLFMPRAQQKGLRLSLELDEALPPIVTGDPGRLQQIVINLISNAIKFTEAGEVLVKVRALRHRKGKTWISFTVKDTGIGVPAEHQGLIFEAFRQADGSMARKYGGTGLGLAISKRLASLMEGTLEVESTPGEGSAFQVIIPFKVVEAEPAIALPASGVIEKAAESYHILLAEDERLNQEFVSRLLEKRGHKVTRVGNGLEVLQVMEENSFDLVLMDVQMPGMDGLEATRHIREREKGTGCHIPIIALTAYASKSDRGKCLDSGMDEYIAKPVRAAEIFPLLEQAAKRDYISSPGEVKVPVKKTAHPFIDSDEIAKKQGGDRSFLRSLLKTLHAMLPVYMKSIEVAIDHHDNVAIGRATHKLKGACAPFGLRGLINKAKVLEARCTDSDWEGIDRDMKSLQREMARLNRELEKLCF